MARVCTIGAYSLDSAKAIESGVNYKQKLVTDVMSDEDVLFYWSLSSVDIVDAEEANELLHHIISLWLTIRGFSLANEWVEKHKWEHRASTVKAKSLRKGLKSSRQNHEKK